MIEPYTRKISISELSYDGSKTDHDLKIFFHFVAVLFDIHGHFNFFTFQVSNSGKNLN